jgi:hypothetical protein
MADDASTPAATVTAIAPNRRAVTPTQHIVAILVVCGYFALIGIMCFKGIPEGNTQPLNIALGALGSGFGAVLAFYFTNMSGARATASTPAQS